MSELGTKLRDARVEKGYTLNTLQQMTKIQKKYLQAIELGNYDEMPGSFYVRAFIKQYADMVGLDGEKLLEEYEDELSANSNGDDESLDSEKDAMPSRAERHDVKEKGSLEAIASYMPLFLLVAIIVAIMVALVMAINSINQEDNDSERVSTEISQSIVSVVEPESVSQNQANESSVVEDEVTELGENDIKVGDQVLTLVSEPGEATTYQLNSAFSDYTFEVVGDAFVWVGVFEDGVIVQDTTIVEGETLEYTVANGTQEVRVSLGYPEGATLFVNGVEVEPQGQYLTETMIFVASDDSSVETAEVESETIELDISETTNDTETNSFEGPAVLDPANNTDGAE